MRAAAALLAALCAAAPLSALELEAELGLGGGAALGRYAPLRIGAAGAPPSSVLELRELGAGGREGPVLRFDPSRYPEFELPLLLSSPSEEFLLELRLQGIPLASRRILPPPRLAAGQLVLGPGLPAPALASLGRALEPFEPLIALDAPLRELPALPLDYDGVAGIAMADPGALLSPAQVEALRSWLASGGRLLLFSALPAGLGLAGALGLPATEGESPLGLGGLRSYAASLAELGRGEDPAFWREALHLEPYGADSRIAAGRLPDTAGLLPELPSPLFALELPVALLGLLWAALLALFAGRRRGLAPMALVSAAAAALALGAAPALQGGRQGLSLGWTRALAFADGSALVELGVAPLKPRGWAALLPFARGRELGFGLGEGGRAGLSAEGSLLSLSTRGLPAYAPRSRAAAEAEFLGWLGPEGVTAATKEGLSRRDGAYLARVGNEGGARRGWLRGGAAGWSAAEEPAALLGRDEPWARRLLEAYPRLDFVFLRAESGLPSPSLAGGRAGAALLAYVFDGELRP